MKVMSCQRIDFNLAISTAVAGVPW